MFLSKKIKVLFLWHVNEALTQYLQKNTTHLPQIELLFPPEKQSKQQLAEWLLAHAPEAAIMVGWRPTDGLLMTATNLKLFINPGAGIKHQIERFKKLNKKQCVVLVNGHGNAYFTAQHAVSLLLALSNKITIHHQLLKMGKWRMGDKQAASLPLRGCTVGLLGYGAVNQLVHRFLSGFDVRFAALRRDWNKQTAPLPTPLIQFTPDELPSFLRGTDRLIVALPETRHTIGLLNASELQLLGDQALLVNVARGAIINEKALYETLHNQGIAGAALDVWYNYKPEEDEEGRKYPYTYPFHELDNVLLSPHRAASPFSDLERWSEVVENITRFANNKSPFLNVVNLEAEY